MISRFLTIFARESPSRFLKKVSAISENSVYEGKFLVFKILLFLRRAPLHFDPIFMNFADFFFKFAKNPSGSPWCEFSVATELSNTAPNTTMKIVCESSDPQLVTARHPSFDSKSVSASTSKDVDCDFTLPFLEISNSEEEKW
jgi:hypothetical protein